MSLTVAEVKKLSEVASIVMGQSPPSDSYNDTGEGLPFFQGKADFGDIHPVERMYCTSPKKKAFNGDILMSVRAPVGDLNIANQEACIGRGLAAIRADESIIDYKYLYYYLNYKKNIIENMGTGSTFKAINKKNVENIEVVMFDLKTQRKIVEVLEKSKQLINKRKAQITSLASLSESVFIEMFGDPVTNNKGWDKVEFSNVMDVLTDYHSNGSYKVLKENVELLDKPDFALMVRTTDLESRNFTENVKYITKDAYEYLKKSQVFGGEIIINKIGSAGRVFLMPELKRPVSLGMNQFMIRINGLADSIFIYNQLISNSIGLEIQKRVQGAVTKTITKAAVRGIKIILPPKSIQEEYSSKVIKIETQLALLQRSLIEFENNFNSLMLRAFRGELFID